MSRLQQSLSLMLLITLGCTAGSVRANKEVLEALPDHLAFYPAAASPDSGVDQVFATKRLWPVGYTLKVCFFGGNPTINELVSLVASEWQLHAGLTFDFGDKWHRRSCLDRDAGFSMIRVGYGERGYWSTVGTDSIYRLHQYQPSMNLEGMDMAYFPKVKSDTSEGGQSPDVLDQMSPYHKSVILHEFGHALGMLHEHQNRELNCNAEFRWKGEGNVYDYLWDTNRWSREKVDRNLGPVGPSGLVDEDAKSDDLDPESIMMYSLPKELFIRGEDSPCYVPHRYKLSAKDIAGIQKRYPRNQSAPSNLSDGPFVPSDLSIAVASPSLSVNEDMLSRARADLTSDNVSVRREARRQMAAALQNSDALSVVRVVKDAAQSDNYRVRLGTVIALESVTAISGMSKTEQAAAIDELKSIKADTKDDTLRKQTGLAIDRVKKWDIQPAGQR